MSKNIYASSHGSIRMKERIGSIKNDKSHLRNAIRNGKTKKDFRGDFYYYILEKESKRDKKIKIYKNFIYIFNKGSHGLITTYPVPEEFLPIEQYEYTEKEKEILNTISMFGRTTVDIQTKDNKLTGIVYFLENKPLEDLELVIDDDSSFELNLKDIYKLDISFYKYEFQ